MTMTRAMTDSINQNLTGGATYPDSNSRISKQENVRWPNTSTESITDSSGLLASQPKRIRAQSDSSQHSLSKDSVSSTTSGACPSVFDKPTLGHSPNSSISSSAYTLEEAFKDCSALDQSLYGVDLTYSPIAYQSLGESALTPTPVTNINGQPGCLQSFDPAATPVSQGFNQSSAQPAPYNIHPAMKPWSVNQFEGQSECPDFISGHNRSHSYQSTLSSVSVDTSTSVDSSSWNESTRGGGNTILDMHAGGQQTSISPVNLDQFAVSGGQIATGTRSNKLPRSVSRTPQEAQMNCGKQQSFTEALNFVNSLAGLPCPNPYGILPVCLPGYPQPFLDPQSLAASVAQFGNPLMDFYGVSPALMAARANALSQLAAGDIGADLSDPASADDGTNSSSKKTNLYKTELCRSWEEKGSCRYGSKCQFAHGLDEQRSINRHPKFKTEICRTFWLHGSCPYGKRCCFLHTTATDGGSAQSVGGSPDAKQSSSVARNAHDPPASRLQQRTSSGLATTADKLAALSLSTYLKGSPQLKSAPPTRSQSELGHSRSSSASRSSEISSVLSGLRIPIGSRFGSKDQVPAQDAPGPRSRLERLRPTGDYLDSNSLPGTSTASTTRYSPLLDVHPPHSASSDISVLSRSPSRHASKAHSANGDEQVKWPSSRLCSGTSVAVA